MRFRLHVNDTNVNRQKGEHNEVIKWLSLQLALCAFPNMPTGLVTSVVDVLLPTRSLWFDWPSLLVAPPLPRLGSIRSP
uniref:Uncharacterized protein n=1 Tax=Anguilla anguilla TaxID=7936 RepID=A0A0E9UBJ7_ANGAN